MPTPTAEAPAAPVRQRCVLVLPSTGEFDSRTYRIARTLHERGHDVTVLARWKAGIPRREIHPVGYPIVRVEVGALDGLPAKPVTTAALRTLRWVYRKLRGLPTSGPSAGRRPATASTAPAATSAEDPDAEPTERGWAHPAARPNARLLDGLIRRARIFLMIRGHRKRALELGPAADVYHGMAYMGISVALALGRRHGGKVLYDSRDIYMVAANLARLHGPAKWLLARMERGWARAADRVLTVNEPYAEELATRFGVPKPLVVMNCSFRQDPPDPPERRFHDALGLPPTTRVVLYQGGFSVGRGVEELVEATRGLPDTVLVLLGYGALEEEFRALAAAEPERVFVLPAVPPTELLAWVASADVVGALFQKDTLNQMLSTPNKFLEAMAAGVPVVCSDHPGMGPIARETGCGIAVAPEDIGAIREALRTILDASPEERAAWRARALAAAHDTYNWETQVQHLLAEYGRLTGRPW